MKEGEGPTCPPGSQHLTAASDQFPVPQLRPHPRPGAFSLHPSLRPRSLAPLSLGPQAGARAPNPTCPAPPAEPPPQSAARPGWGFSWSRFPAGPLARCAWSKCRPQTRRRFRELSPWTGRLTPAPVPSQVTWLFPLRLYSKAPTSARGQTPSAAGLSINGNGRCCGSPLASFYSTRVSGLSCGNMSTEPAPGGGRAGSLFVGLWESHVAGGGEAEGSEDNPHPPASIPQLCRLRGTQGRGLCSGKWPSGGRGQGCALQWPFHVAPAPAFLLPLAPPWPGAHSQALRDDPPLLLKGSSSFILGTGLPRRWGGPPVTPPPTCPRPQRPLAPDRALCVLRPSLTFPTPLPPGRIASARHLSPWPLG